MTISKILFNNNLHAGNTYCQQAKILTFNKFNGKKSSNDGVQFASAELDSDLLEFDENFASENHRRNSKNSAFHPRSESSLTSGMKSLIFKKENLG